jgi:hypothetical protein
MAPRTGSPTKGKAPALPHDDETHTERSDSGSDNVQAQLQTLQRSQADQEIKAQETNQKIDQIQNLLQQLLTRNESRGRSVRRSSPPPHESRDPSPLPSVLPTIERTSETPTALTKSARSARLPDPDKLSDGVEPSFEYWEVEIHSKFQVNADHYETEAARMAYVFARTQGDARKHLFPRYNTRTANSLQFLTAQAMVDCLAEIYTNPHRVRDARVQYSSLTMEYGQPFHEFKTQFLHLAAEAQIPEPVRFYDLYDKLPASLQDRLAAQLHTYRGRFSDLCNATSHLDSELKRITARRQKTARDRPVTATPRPAPATYGP